MTILTIPIHIMRFKDKSQLWSPTRVLVVWCPQKLRIKRSLPYAQIAVVEMSPRIEVPAEGYPGTQHNGIQVADRKLAECVMHACHPPPFWLSPKRSGVSAPLHGNMTSTHIFGNFTPGLLSASIMGTSLICQSWPGCSARAGATYCTCMAS